MLWAVVAGTHRVAHTLAGAGWEEDRGVGEVVSNLLFPASHPLGGTPRSGISFCDWLP